MEGVVACHTPQDPRRGSGASDDWRGARAEDDRLATLPLCARDIVLLVCFPHAG